MINNTTESKRSNEIIFIPETDNQISEILYFYLALAHSPEKKIPDCLVLVLPST